MGDAWVQVVGPGGALWGARVNGKRDVAIFSEQMNIRRIEDGNGHKNPMLWPSSPSSRSPSSTSFSILRRRFFRTPFGCLGAPSGCLGVRAFLDRGPTTSYTLLRCFDQFVHPFSNPVRQTFGIVIVRSDPGMALVLFSSFSWVRFSFE